jgi:hypothetical protein
LLPAWKERGFFQFSMFNFQFSIFNFRFSVFNPQNPQTPQTPQTPRAPRASQAKPREEEGFFGLVPLWIFLGSPAQ